MKKKRKILSILIKVLIGIGSLLLIYFRLSNDLTPEKLLLLTTSLVSVKGLLLLTLCLLLVPVNWGIESFKWQIITRPVERISFGRANRSVYSGVCLGNFAPGRATEFIAKILFFENDNRPRVTVLHFINGMFQFSVTVIIGFSALLIKLSDFSEDYYWIVYVAAAVGIILISVLALCIYNIKFLLNFITKKISGNNNLQEFNYTFRFRQIAALFGFSLFRYVVFFTQFALVLSVFGVQTMALPVLAGISVYFLVTATIPMFSVVEAAIRAAVALVVFKGTDISDTVIALCTVVIWLVNIILPSLAGYYFLLQENFNFKIERPKP